MDRATCYLVLIALLIAGCPGSGLLDSDGDGASDAEDCAPDDPTIYPGADDLENDGIDQNCDGEDGVFSCDADGDGYANPGCNGNDCDDHDPEVNVGQTEVCDGKDTDCDGDLPGGEVDFDLDGAATCDGDCDDNDSAFNLLDEDGDGFATCGVLRDCDDLDAALTPADLDFDGYSTCTGDCNDGEGLVHPLAVEVCDGLDSDCNGEVPKDELDNDGDGFAACADCDDNDEAAWGSDEDGDGFDPCEGDCDETSASIHPGAFDPWGDGQDHDCSGADGVDWDGDGWPGNATPPETTNPNWDCNDFDPSRNRDDLDGDTVDTCAEEPDCDDDAPQTYPGAPEDACDGVDTDCLPDPLEVDDDADGFMECEGDCDDGDAGLNLADGDSDGVTTCGGDCDDADSTRPGAGAWEPPDDGIDSDCNGFDAGGVFWASARIAGSAASDWTGWRVVGGADLDGDGVPDLAVGSPGNDSAGSGAGATQIFWSTTVAAGGDFQTSSADTVLVGELSGDGLGRGLSLGGDRDGDGVADLLVGAPHNDEATGNAGKAYGVASSALLAGGELLAADSSSVTLLGEGGYAFNGYAVDGTGDFDGDGVSDFVAGAHAAVETGRTYIIFSGTAPVGGAFTPADVDVMITGPHDHGFSITALPDIDGDGLSELLIGNPGEDAAGVDSGSAWLFYSATLADGGSFGASDVDVVLQAEAAGDLLGHSVAASGDVDGDGVADLLIGAPGNAAGGPDAGRVYLVFGAELPPSGALQMGSVGLVIDGLAGDLGGTAVAGAGDVDGDGLADILIGAPGNSTVGTDAGAVYVFLGSSLAPGSTSVAAADHAILGEAPGDSAGFSLSGAGDVDGDGHDDVLIGAWGNDDGGSDAGKAYLLFSPY